MKPNYILFSDGSVRINTKGDHISGYGVVILDTRTSRYVKFGGELNSKSIAFAEVWAIYRGLQFIAGTCKKAKEKAKVLVVSDSNITIQSFNDYIPSKKWDLSNWSYWKKSNSKPVKNQNVYRNILTLIDDHHMTVKFVHMYSHLDIKDLEKVKNKLSKYNLKATDDMARLFLAMNALADKTASDITYDMIFSVKSIMGEVGTHLKWKKVENS